MPDQPSRARRVVIAAGGTGGHLFPAEALAEVLIVRGWRVVLATDERAQGISQTFPAERIVHLPAATARGRNPLVLARAGYTVMRGVGAGRAALEAFDPDVVVGFGGYPSAPALLAAISQRRPTVIHEQNAVIGRANRMLAPRVSAVACAFASLAKADKRIRARAVVVGNPVRPEIRALAGEGYQPPKDEIRILATGGSQGARVLSEMVPAALEGLPEGLRIRLKVEQQVRLETLSTARSAYARALIDAEVQPFFRDMADRLARAHLVIGRAGASTVSELCVAGRPSLLVPLAIAVDNDQGLNAAILADAGAAVVLAERGLTPDLMSETLAALLTDPARLERMAQAAGSLARPDAAERLADLVERTAR